MELLNQALFVTINGLANQNYLIDIATILIGEYMPYIFIIVEIYIYFILNAKYEALFAFYSVLLGLTISKLIGMVYVHNRPFVDGIGITLSQHLPDSSFPSDHTVFVFSIAIALIFRSKTIKIASILFIFAVLQGLARIVEGVHYPFDILGAIGVASISVLTIFVFKDQFKSIDKYITKLI